VGIVEELVILQFVVAAQPFQSHDISFD